MLWCGLTWDNWQSRWLQFTLVEVGNYVLLSFGVIHHGTNKPSPCCIVVKIPIWILRFYNLTCPKWFESFKHLCDHLGSYNFNDPKQSWFIVIFFNLTEGLVGPKWKITSQQTKFCYSNVERKSFSWTQMKSNISIDCHVLKFLVSLNDTYKWM